MKRVLILLFLAILVNFTYAQINGPWQGVLIQPNKDGSSSNYAIWLNLRIEGEIIRGKLRSERANSPYYKVSDIKGYIKGDTIIIVEDSIINQETAKGSAWCFIKCRLVYNSNEETLKGSYTSKTDGCLPGSIVLIKSNKNFNSKETTHIALNTFEKIKQLIVENETVVGQQFTLQRVTFLSGKYQLSKNSYQYLNEVITFLKNNPTLKIHLKGHTDSDGNDENNFILSKQRAESVANYFIKRKINTARITFEGFGKSRPVAENVSKEGKQKNRRVELLIVAQ